MSAHDGDGGSIVVAPTLRLTATAAAAAATAAGATGNAAAGLLAPVQVADEWIEELFPTQKQVQLQRLADMKDSRKAIAVCHNWCATGHVVCVLVWGTLRVQAQVQAHKRHRLALRHTAGSTLKTQTGTQQQHHKGYLLTP